ncbi:MAG: M14/M99 family metallopeptidase [Candidatus Adiutrix sp.]
MPSINWLKIFFFIFLITPSWAFASTGDGVLGKNRQHLIFWEGTPQELEVYKIFGRQEGPTAMIIGGIQGDEPGGFLSADLYTDLALKRGNLIVVPRANFKSIIMFSRGSDGDMNRKFGGDLSQDPDEGKIALLKSLMAESDLLLNLHDGSGYYRPHWESNLANPHRYGQCIIADTDVYVHPQSGRTITLGDYAREVILRVNEDIKEPLHKFHFFNTNTADTKSPYKEQRSSATFYALTQLGIPAFGVETSKNLPSLEMKIHQHNLAVNAFLDIFGIEIEQPRIMLDPPVMSYMVISVNHDLPIAVADGQTLLLNSGDTIEVVHIGANYDRGLSVDVLGLGSFNDIRRPLAITQATRIVARKDNTKIGQVDIGVLPLETKNQPPRLLGTAKIRSPKAGVPAVLAAANQKTIKPEPQDFSFLIEVDGRPITLNHGQKFEVLSGSQVKMVDIKIANEASEPQGLVMNLKGFVPKEKENHNDGEDRGFVADTGKLMTPFSVGKKGVEYEINAEVGRNILASTSLIIIKPQLNSVILDAGAGPQTALAPGAFKVKSGAQIGLIDIILAGGQTLSTPRLTLGGREIPPHLPQTITMPAFAVNLAVFNGETLAGKLTFTPEK